MCLILSTTMKRILLLIAFVLLWTHPAFATAPFVNSCANGVNGSSNTTSCAISGTAVSAGDSVMCAAGWAVDGLTASVSDGTSNFTGGAVNPGTNWSTAHLQVFYLSSSVATGTPTYTLTVTGAFGPHIACLVFTPTGALAFDTDIATASGGALSTSVDSGSITTTGSDELVIGALMAENSPTVSAQAIGGTSATTNHIEFASGAFTIAAFYLAKTGTINATATLTTGQKYVANEAGFKIAAGGGAAPSGLLLMSIGK